MHLQTLFLNLFRPSTTTLYHPDISRSPRRKTHTHRLHTWKRVTIVPASHWPFHSHLTHTPNPVIWLPVRCRLSVCDRLLVSTPVSVHFHVCAQPDFKASRSFHLPRRWIRSLERAMPVCTSLCVCVYFWDDPSRGQIALWKEGIETLAVAWYMNINGSFTVTVIVSDKATKSHSFLTWIVV